MNLFIKSTGILSAAGSNSDASFLESDVRYDTDRLLCKEPDYAAYIPPMQLRRMSKAVRMGIGAAKICLQQAGIEKADAIAVGTAFGCLNDTEVFLSKMIEQDEQMLTPTAFIQSTHNTVAGQVALVTGCHGHNLTYVHRGHSFEHAMIDAALYLHDHGDEQILVGGIEELTETSLNVLKYTQAYRHDASTPGSVLTSSRDGSIAGEGATFFMVQQRPHGSGLNVKDIATFTTRDTSAAVEQVSHFLYRNNMSEPDMVLLGLNGDKRSAPFYNELKSGLLANVSQVAFKHLCGEYPVAGAFALALLMNALQKPLPSSCMLNHPPKQLKNVLLINNFLHHYSCYHLQVF